jgi:hypothetical protein
VPRLRGRGQQGNIVMHTPFLSALYWRRLTLAPKSAARRGSCPILSLACHGLASEARSTTWSYLSAQLWPWVTVVRQCALKAPPNPRSRGAIPNWRSTPILHHAAWPDSRTRTTTRTIKSDALPPRIQWAPVRSPIRAPAIVEGSVFVDLSGLELTIGDRFLQS